MKSSLACYFLGLVVLTGAVWLQAQQSAGAEQAVTALEQKWLQSQKTNDPDLVIPLLADKFVNTESDGKVMNKAESLAEAKATNMTAPLTMT